MIHNDAAKTPRRLAIIGGGSSGLICLKTATELLEDWDIVCFEKSDSIKGCWGNPYPGFVSTSTRYTTQFACYPICHATLNPDGGHSREEFFKGGEYGEYLESFTDHFGLRKHIRLNHHVENVQRNASGGWQLKVTKDARPEHTLEHFDAVILCTGLAAKPKPIESDKPQLTAKDLNRREGLEAITNQNVVVIGGGESAVDFANRLANPESKNEVYLSLHSGVRVSPRYHPVRGVPSDFLRNRLMLSVHPDIRNRLGQIFVEWRIKYQKLFERMFPSGQAATPDEDIAQSDEQLSAEERRKHWTLQLTLAAKDDLFNMFHNKSDDFLEAVGDQRIKIVGGPIDSSYTKFKEFHSESSENPITVDTDCLVPAIGYESTLGSLTDSNEKLTDFFLGCCHIKHPDLFLVGFARPIIGNIPTISEMQARFICSILANAIARPADMVREHSADLEFRRARYKNLNLEAAYPVEMMTYCDRLAALAKLTPGPRISSSPYHWWRTKLIPAATLHYFHENKSVRPAIATAPIYMPVSLIVFILAVKPFDWIYRLSRWVVRR